MYERWIQDQLRHMPRGKTQEGLANYLGVSQPVVSRMAAGERRIKLDELEKICRYLELSLPWLTDQQWATHQSRDVMVLGQMAERVWRERSSFKIDVAVPAVPDPRYSKMHQYAMLIAGVFEPHARNGDFAVFADFGEARAGVPLNGDLIHVVRQRDDLEEHTLRECSVVDGVITLKCPTSEPISWSRAGPMPEGVTLRGLYLTIYRPPR